MAPDFPVPRTLEGAQFQLRPASVDDAEADYAAVMASAGPLAEIFPDSTWPCGLTLEQDRAELEVHEALFEARRAFAYSVVSVDGRTVLGSVYVNPSSKVGFDAEVYLWWRKARLGSVEDRRLEHTVQAWLSKAWPFARPAMPGRTISWASWRALPDADGSGSAR